MENTLTVAKTMYDMYQKRYHASMDEMKMHKLMYFLQRESLLENDSPLFEESFYAWKYGPVLKSVRSEYAAKGTPFSSCQESPNAGTRKLVGKVLDMYGGESSWTLSCMSHEELSWKVARKGLDAGVNGDVPLNMSAMKFDALREKMDRLSA